MIKYFLVVVDMQNDFIDGSLGTPEARSIVPNAVEKIARFDGDIFVTLDTHDADYLDTAEGRKLPVEHCIKGTDGHLLHPSIRAALEGKNVTYVEKPTFGSFELVEKVREKAGNDDFSVTLIGLCTDICVVSNALLLKAAFYEKDICVDPSCCAGVTPETHEAALCVMKSCQISLERY
mgnify:FL=1